VSTELDAGAEVTWPLEPAEPEPELGGSGAAPAQPANVLDVLRRQRAKLADEHTLDLVVPGWNGLLGLRLGPVTNREIGAMLDRVKRGSTAEQLGTALDTLAAACRCALFRARAGDPFEPITVDGVELALEPRLAEGLELGEGITTARGVLVALYAGANAPDVALLAANNDYSEWARQADADIDEEHLGE
jgi:hypothetical protein